VQFLSRGIATGAVPAARLDFEAAAMPWYASLVRRLTLVLGSAEDGQDVAQETYLRAYESWGRFDGADVRAWLYTIGLRLAFNRLRSHRRRLAALERLEAQTWTDPADPDLAAALSELEPRTRAAILLTIVDGYTQAEAATILGAPTGTVSSWIARGRTRLRETLGE
jgi:RNA polymerase sigma-70 factor, ECF subfamily